MNFALGFVKQAGPLAKALRAEGRATPRLIDRIVGRSGQWDQVTKPMGEAVSGMVDRSIARAAARGQGPVAATNRMRSRISRAGDRVAKRLAALDIVKRPLALEEPGVAFDAVTARRMGKKWLRAPKAGETPEQRMSLFRYGDSFPEEGTVRQAQYVADEAADLIKKRFPAKPRTKKAALPFTAAARSFSPMGPKGIYPGARNLAKKVPGSVGQGMTNARRLNEALKKVKPGGRRVANVMDRALEGTALNTRG